jgi:peptide/nickel transport system permease protein
MDIMGSQYVEASRALGAGNIHIIFRRILHNVAAPLLIQFTGSIFRGLADLYDSGLHGDRNKSPDARVGNLVFVGVAYLRTYPHIALFPCLAIILTVLSLNILGNGLSDALGTGSDG